MRIDYKNEIKLLREKQKGEGYGIAVCDCVESLADAVMKILDEQDHSGFSYSMTMKYFKRILNDLPLTSLEDTDDSWRNFSCDDPTEKDKIHKRYTGLYKLEDGSFVDVDRFVFIDVYNPDHPTSWSCGGKFINKLFPITFPYMPESEPIKIYGQMIYLSDKDEDETLEHPGEFNFKTYDYAIMPDGERVDIYKAYDERCKSYIDGMTGCYIDEDELIASILPNKCTKEVLDN